MRRSCCISGQAKVREQSYWHSPCFSDAASLNRNVLVCIPFQTTQCAHLLTPWLTGGAVLRAPLGAAPQHVEALLAVACMRAAQGPPPSSQAATQASELPSHYLRTVHLDLSGHALSVEQVQDLLLDAPWRLRQCLMLEGLVLAGCQLSPGAVRQQRAAAGLGHTTGAAAALQCCRVAIRLQSTNHASIAWPPVHRRGAAPDGQLARDAPHVAP